MKNIIFLTIIVLPLIAFSQNKSDSTAVFKKRVLENTELSILTSYYSQDGQNAAVTGGIGTEKLTDFATDINVSIPLNDDDVLSISGTVSAYTSASSSNLDAFDGDRNADGSIKGTPWAASSGASYQDAWANINAGYNHSSDDRNTVVSGNLSFANEFDYSSIGAGAGVVKLFNEKNTEIGINASVYLDFWRPEYPSEIKTYMDNNGNLNAGFFSGTDILDQSGTVINKFDPDAWKPFKNELIDKKARNTYAFSLSFSQILTKTTQISIFSDITYQSGWLANPMQRVYFADKDNFYIGNAVDIPNYTNSNNQGVFQLADDIERLPDSRFKIPIGIRLNQYINEWLVLRTFYRYYFDDWDLKSNTFNVELAIKITQKFTLYPNYRFYNQNAIDYFAPYNQHLSSSQYYTSDFDLSKYNANQFGLGVKYTDIFTHTHIGKFALKELTLDYNHYERNTGLSADIISLGASFILDK
ncbi:MAG: hypothetical protein PWQ54_276 [Bacteroidales bacterium]|jgi:hypothetical protein|nr:hypothetical protein [Bacteroidales bacterium]